MMVCDVVDWVVPSHHIFGKIFKYKNVENVRFDIFIYIGYIIYYLKKGKKVEK
jgi:hypothetical protein